MPLSDFGSHDPDFSTAQVAECARIVAGLRAINTKIVRLSGSAAELAAAADAIEALSASLDSVTRSRAIETFRYRFDRDDPNDVLPFNPATGAFNPLAPAIAMRVEGDTLVADVTFPASYESAPDTVQGGMVRPTVRRFGERRTMIFAHDDLQTIVEGEFVGGLRVGGQGRKGQANCAEQQASSAAG